MMIEPEDSEIYELASAQKPIKIEVMSFTALALPILRVLFMALAP
tara:strand:- start:12596 stop:12730 length:135 start_codon:yes stop_codon:yes gene_type:complete